MGLKTAGGSPVSRYPENLAQLLPPETVKFRLRHWLRDGCEWVPWPCDDSEGGVFVSVFFSRCWALENRDLENPIEPFSYCCL